MAAKGLKGMTIGIGIAIVGVAGWAHAGVVKELRCQARAKMAESRLLRCVSGCGDRALLVASYDEAACQDRCGLRYEGTIARLTCSFEVRTAATLEEMDGDSLRCQSDVERLTARALLCSAHCPRPRNSEQCNDDCDAQYTAALDTLPCTAE